ncbi:MAG TPA: hypothetical protein VHX15_13785 [Frankiaceae bacterium]|jgi:hypothetical protein|nr:hypothetical protein [Frankiaceae bacterium]
MKKLAAIGVSAVLTAVLAALLVMVVAVSGGGAHKPAPTAGSSWAKVPGISLPSLGGLGSLLGL